jgi:hypothetical protein
MKKQLRLIWALVALSTVAMAGVTVEIDGFEVFKENDFNFATRIMGQTVSTWEWAQNWKDARIISLKVPGGNDVWLANITTNWYGTNDDLKDIYKMDSDSFGYIKTSEIDGYTVPKSDYSVTPGKETTTDITYHMTLTDDSGEITDKRDITTTGYLLGHFEEDTEIYLAMTPLGTTSKEMMDTYQLVDVAGTDMQSRKLTTWGLEGDQATNMRINFGWKVGASVDPAVTGAEFVALYATPKMPPTGQPLPGGLLAGLLAFGTVTAGSLKKKRS